MIETHAHIYDSDFDDDRDPMLNRAFDSGIKQIWMPNCSSETIEGMYNLEEKYPHQCFSMMGLHPGYVDEGYQNELAIIEAEMRKRSFIMVGEIGIDYYWDLSFVEQQYEAFTFQLGLAQKYNLPICIHSRGSKDGQLNAIQKCCDLIEDFGWKDLRGIFHCFSGDLNDAHRVLNLHFLLGIGGVSTFKNGKIDQFLAEIPLNKIVLETDSPYLAPVPYRGKRNEPAYLSLVVEKLSDIYEVNPEVIKAQTTENALRLIGK